MDMTKTAVKAALGIETDADLARVFDPELTRGAVNFWEDDKPIPELRQHQLRARFPEIFKDAA